MEINLSLCEIMYSWILYLRATSRGPTVWKVISEVEREPDLVLSPGLAVC